MTKGFGIAALIIVIISIFIPGFGVFISGVPLIIATFIALAGERIFTTATAIIAAVNFFFLSPATLATSLQPGATPWLIMILVFLAAPFAGMILNASGVVAFNKAQNS